MTTGGTHFRPDLLAGRTAVITGGGSGIGYAIAEAFLSVSADVVITSRSAQRLAEAEARLGASTGRLCASLPCDVRDESDVARLHDFVGSRFGAVSVVVNNAAANFRMPAERMTRRALETVVDTDLIGSLVVTRQFLPDLIAADGAAVLSIVIAGAERGFPGFAHAGAAKAALVSLTCSWAREWGPYGIRVNAIAPGPVPTRGVAANMLGHDPAQAGEAFAEHRSVVPLGRLGRPANVASAAVFLCSDAASWITGQNLTLDGGITLSLPP